MISQLNASTITSHNTGTIVKLTPPPKVSEKDIIGITFGIRPYRKGGIRLESEKIGSKTIYHNYGHGGGGVSLGYGCSKIIVDKFLCEHGSDTNEVAIVGSGYMGLFEAIMLADIGIKVTVYAESFPIQFGAYNQNTNKAPITSQVAGGLWLPYGYDLQNKPLHVQAAIETFRYYQKCIQENKYQGLAYKDYYMMDIKNPIPEFVPKSIFETRDVKIDFGNGIYHDAMHCKTILMDGDKFLNELYTEAQAKGVEFKEKSFQNLNDFLSLKEKCVFNCTGNGSHKLFNDENMIPISGHLLYVNKVSNVDYFMGSVTADKKDRVTIYPQGNKLAIGLSYDEFGWIKKPIDSVVKKLIHNINDFTERKASIISPKL